MNGRGIMGTIICCSIWYFATTLTIFLFVLFIFMFNLNALGLSDSFRVERNTQYAFIKKGLSNK